MSCHSAEAHPLGSSSIHFVKHSHVQPVDNNVIPSAHDRHDVRPPPCILLSSRRNNHVHVLPALPCLTTYPPCSRTTSNVFITILLSSWSQSSHSSLPS